MGFFKDLGRTVNKAFNTVVDNVVQPAVAAIPVVGGIANATIDGAQKISINDIKGKSGGSSSAPAVVQTAVPTKTTSVSALNIKPLPLGSIGLRTTTTAKKSFWETVKENWYWFVGGIVAIVGGVIWYNKTKTKNTKLYRKKYGKY